MVQAFRAQSGFIDVNQIDKSSWSALSHDLLAGETSIIASAFGTTMLCLLPCFGLIHLVSLV
jgi:hypothetical protein